MAGAHSQAQTIRLKPSPPAPSQALLDGIKFRRWDDEESDVVLKVDETGLLLSMLSDKAEGIPLYISEISDVRMGKYAKRPKDPKLQEALSASAGVQSFDEIGISIVHGQNMVDVSFIHLVARAPGQAATFVDDIRKLLYNVVGVNASEEFMLRREYARLCTLRNPEKDGIASRHFQSLFDIMNRDEFKSVMSLMGWGVGPKDFIPMEDFTFAAFMKLYENLVPMDYVSDVFAKLRQSKGTKPYATVKEFCRFLNEHHRDPCSNEILFPHLKEEEAQQIITQIEPNKDYAEKGQLTAQGLRTYLRSKENAVIHLSRFSLHQDMDQPLTHYFINSSHNTYLIGHQLRGKATVEIYRQVLLSGCRCIELDCWDGESGEPVITHGMTLVNNIPFKDVVEAINESAFKASMFPVILSFENHCRFRQQRRMVAHLRTILGDKLLLETLEDYPLQPGVPLPPPSKLLGKIICKNKLLVPKEGRAREDGTDFSGTLPRSATLDRYGRKTGIAIEQEVEIQQISIKSEMNMPVTPIVGVSTWPSENVDGSVEESSADDHPTTNLLVVGKPGRSKSLNQAAIKRSGLTPGDRLGDADDTSQGNKHLTPEFPVAASRSKSLVPESSSLSNSNLDLTTGCWSELDMPSLVNYAEPVKFKSFTESEKANKHYQMSSFAETAGVRLVLDWPKECVRYTKRQNVRIYPKGTRVDSSNYQPQVFWNVGCQMVSLNFQTLDVPMQLNKGKFDYNGMCGYLLKPEVMRNAGRDFDPFAESPIDNVVAGSMKVQVLAGHMLSSTKDKVMVEVDMYGIPADTVRRRFKTKSVMNDITVNFRSPPFEFKKIILCDMAMLRFAVLDSQGSLLGMRVLPLDGLEPGFRYVHLNNENNQSLPLASLFVNIVVGECLPEGTEEICTGLMDPVRYLKEKHTEQLGDMMGYDIIKESDSTVRPPIGADHGNRTAVDTRPPTPQPERPAPSAVCTTGRDVLMSKDSDKQLHKISKELSSIRKKYLKAHATMTRAQAAEMRKLNGNADAMLARQQSLVEELVRLSHKSLEDEEAVLIKMLPLFFTWAAKALASRHASESKQLEDHFKKQVANLTDNIQKENTRSSNQFKEEQKHKVQDKDELQRKIREHRFKLVGSAVEARRKMERSQTRERDSAEMSQQTAMADLKKMAGMEMERTKKAYSIHHASCTGVEGVSKYVCMALDDHGVALASLAEPS